MKGNFAPFTARRHKYVLVVQPDPAPRSSNQHSVLLSATGRSDVSDALKWIAEGRQLIGGVTHRLLTALVAVADAGQPDADQALRVVARQALHSTLDTSADLISTDSIVPPARYQAALAEIASRTSTGTLASITPQAVGAAQSSDPLVVETLALVAGLSWRDLRDRSRSRGVVLPSKSSGPWKPTQIRSAFDVIDDIVLGNVQPQLEGATAARPLELLLDRVKSWNAVEALRSGGVSYGTLLAQRDVGSAWSAHRNRTNTEISRLVILEVLSVLSHAGVPYWSAEGATPVSPEFLSNQVVAAGSKAPGQLSVVTRGPDGQATYAVFVAVARDGGTARKTAATFLRLPEILALPGALVLAGTGWADRSESDKLIRAFSGRIYTEHTLRNLAELAADFSDPN